MRSLITTDDDLEGITKWGENLLSIAAACRERVDHHLLQRAGDVSSVISSRSSAAAARYSRRNALEVELERLKLEHEQAERQRQLQATHEQERFKEEQEQLALKRQIDVLDEQERSIYGDDELQPPRTRSFSYADTVQHWLSANGARKKVEAPRSNDVLQTTSCAQKRTSPVQRPLPTGPAVPTDFSAALAAEVTHPAALPADVTQPYPAARPFTSDKGDGHRSSAPAAQPTQLLHPCHSLLASRLPKMEIPKFSGRTRDWPVFITSFRQSVHDILDPDTDRLNILRELLDDDVKRSVSKYLYNPKCYEELMRILERRYGNPQRIIHACLKSIEALSTWKDFDLPGLRSFCNELQGIVATLSLGNHHVEIESAGNLMAAVKKMPERLRDDWGRHVVENFDQRPPNLRDLSDWLEMRREAAEAVSEDFDDENKTKHRHVGQRFRRPSVYTTVAQPVEGSPVSDGPAIRAFSRRLCVICHENHRLAYCKMFRELSIEKRADVVKANKLLLSLLGK
ncbi:hypothetical protein M513_09991 [Trichuris suis]|uniref:Uncharacterized protein n=1 Tax=Trichuris suis TaxID=68888 RepID=A0A085LW21_9BILA|nr:hypothetical protein M513_09991 [Trichuris suis]